MAADTSFVTARDYFMGSDNSSNVAAASVITAEASFIIIGASSTNAGPSSTKAEVSFTTSDSYSSLGMVAFQSFIVAWSVEYTDCLARRLPEEKIIVAIGRSWPSMASTIAENIDQ